MVPVVLTGADDWALFCSCHVVTISRWLQKGGHGVHIIIIIITVLHVFKLIVQNKNNDKKHFRTRETGVRVTLAQSSAVQWIDVQREALHQH